MPVAHREISSGSSTDISVSATKIISRRQKPRGLTSGEKYNALIMRPLKHLYHSQYFNEMANSISNRESAMLMPPHNNNRRGNAFAVTLRASIATSVHYIIGPMQ